ncbi:type II toxin-antitoxin system Phd/YefM family antitoxin [Serratia ureilytica]|uniref:type II toxin-antitoxin system Phd/YefM family antitoxin n=1 Tax=Serratia ureilytica TaxID=300181 RepID=UPI003714B5AF
MNKTAAGRVIIKPWVVTFKARARTMETNMKTVTDAEFRANLADMLDYLRSGGTITVIGDGQNNVTLSGADLSPEDPAAAARLKSLREKVRGMSQTPLVQALRDLEKQHPALFIPRKIPLSFEDAMKRTREKHAEIIKRLEDN